MRKQFRAPWDLLLIIMTTFVFGLLLGIYKAYATHRRKTVVILTNNNEQIVIIPDDPELFVQTLRDEAKLAV